MYEIAVTEQFSIETLASSHDRKSFACGVPALDHYLRQLAGQDTRRRFANCFVAIERASGTIAGFYTLSAASVPIVDLPAEVTARLPHYASLPAALIGRLAVDHRFRGQRVGAILLLEAADRAIDSAPAVFALLVDAKDEVAASFYRHFEFLPLRNNPMTFFLPISSLERRWQLDTP